MGKEAYFQLVAGYTKLDRRLIERMTLFPAAYTISPRSLAVLNDLMVKTGLLSKRIDLGPYLFT